MSPERTIAIAITRKFRRTMDDVFRPSDIDKVELHNDIDQMIEDYAPEELSALPGKFKTMFKSMLCKAKQEIVDQQKTTYDSMLGEVISDAMYELEQHFKSNYSDDELAQIRKFIESDAGKKMMFDMGSTELLMKHQEKVRIALNEIAYEMTSSDDMASALSDLIISMSYQDDMDDPYDEDFGDENVSEDDEW